MMCELDGLDKVIPDTLPVNVSNEMIAIEKPVSAGKKSIPTEKLVPDEELLDMTDDKGEGPAIGIIMENLIKDAQCYKSFAVLFKLQAVKEYLELSLKYSQNPKINNPQTHTSLAVARGIGKGPYFA